MSTEGKIYLVRARFGLANIYQNQVNRTQSMSINSQDVDLLNVSKINGRVSQNTLHEIGVRTGGVSTQADGYAFIEDGWDAPRRGLAMLEFEIESAMNVEEKLHILGYLAGGSPSVDEGVPEDVMFVPVRNWVVNKTMQMMHTGLMKSTSNLTSASQVLLNNPMSSGGSFAIRPLDIVDGASGMVADDVQDQSMNGGMESQYVGTSNSILQHTGAAYSKAKNQSPGEYAKQLLKSSLRAGSSMETSRDPYGSMGDACMDPGLSETALHRDPFFKTMRHALGMGQMQGFQGFSVGQIAYVFENLPDVMDINACDGDRFQIEDHRLTTNELGSSNYNEIIGNELSSLAQYILVESELGYLDIAATNNVQNSVDNVNGMPVGFVVGECGLLVDGLEGSLEERVEKAKELFLSHFFLKYATPYLHDRTLISFRMTMRLFGETVIEIFTNGDESNKRRIAFPTFSTNRTDLTLASMESAVNTGTTFFRNLKDYFNF